MTPFDIELETQQAIENPIKYTTLGPNEWPVGAILPVYYPHRIELPPGWCICAGQIITEPASPFFNLHAPNLTDERFPMGTSSPTSYGKNGGANLLVPSGNHSHTYTIQKHAPQPSPDGYQGRGPNCYVSTMNTSSNGDHDHGGENRPNWFGLLYIMKYI